MRAWQVQLGVGACATHESQCIQKIGKSSMLLCALLTQAYQILRRGGVPEDNIIIMMQVLVGCCMHTALQPCSIFAGVVPAWSACMVVVLKCSCPFSLFHLTTMQDDLARSGFNPHPGKVFNKPGGPDVYNGISVVSGAAMHAGEP